MIYQGRQRRQEFASAAKGRRPAFRRFYAHLFTSCPDRATAILTKASVERGLPFGPKDSNFTKKLCPLHSPEDTAAGKEEEKKSQQ